MIRNKLKLSNRQWDATSSAGESVALRSKLIEITVKRQLSVVAVPLSQSRDTLYSTSLYTVDIIDARSVVHVAVGRGKRRYILGETLRSLPVADPLLYPLHSSAAADEHFLPAVT